jgi:steroid 5-alpha reductase family enzyme
LSDIVLPAFYACLVVTSLCWLLSVVTREYSWVDRIWSLAPVGYVWWFASRAGFADARTTLMAVLVTVWGARLTFNYARKGGYWVGGEDYRWAVLRERLGPVWFQVFNATFIAPYQNLLIFAFTLPVAVCAKHPGVLSWPDVVIAAVFLTLLVGETVADEQQWRFHRAKKEGRASGFLETGLFRYSRHPNFFCEFSMWWCIYAFSVHATGEWLHEGLPGPVLLTLLFVGSTRFTESITAAKYPTYADYQRRTSALVPLPTKD